jgi:HAD superfamily phosphoserine phosphatase-like hydrolase
MNENVVLFDFDNTLTKTDTTKFLLLSLMFYRPFSFLKAIHLLRKSRYNKEKLQGVKVEIIGSLIGGYSVNSLKKRLRVYTFLTKLTYQKFMVDILKRFVHDQYHVIIATASPTFAIADLFGKNVIVIGTEFVIKNDLYTGQVQGEPCFAESKACMVNEYLKNNNFTDVEAAYSDDEIDKPFLLLARESYIVSKIKGLIKFSE